ncbi:hypothetical protein H8356DRAFT_1437856 [Neocallimastix lanati (nom. inval.)]|nr:hypothetical protein H8356DRAFT_1437856 [Neocallimastix sp. JGI-2020a]
MEDNIEIEISETNRGNEQIIINKKHKFNFSFQRKDKSKIYRCTEYKTLNKCKSLIILNDKKEVLKYESLHNHLEKEIDVSISVAKHKIKEEIKKNSIPMDIKPKHIFNAVSQEMGLICPKYNDIPIESEYYKTKRNENFMIFKNTDLIIFQLPFQAYLFSNYHKNIFADGTFYAAPKFSYQLFITKTYVGEFNMFYTTSISILKNKKQSTSLEKQKNILCYHEVKNNNDQKIFSATDEIKILIENYKSKEINLFYNGCNRNELIKLWKECLIDLNDININLK